MSRLESAKRTERIVGVERDPVEHLGRAVSAEQRVYILHSQRCMDTQPDLRKCPFSVALDLGIDGDVWCLHEDVPVLLSICPDNDDLLPNPLPESHDCASCQKCLHDGAKCCGCYDDACCQEPYGSQGAEARFLATAAKHPIDSELLERAKRYVGDPLPLGHLFIGVAGHPDDDECTYRADGTDETYCGEQEFNHEPHGSGEPTT